MASDTMAAASAIEKAVNDNWDAEVAPVAWPTVPFTKPDGPWIRVTIVWGDGFTETMGGSGTGLNRLVGVIIVQVFDKPGAGEGQLNGLADDVRDLFNRKILESIVRCSAASPPQKAGDEKGWDQMNVSIPFEVIESVS